MWMIWRCPHCKGYYEEIAIDEHKEVCPDGSQKQAKKTMQEGGLQVSAGSEDSPEGTT